MCGPIAIALPLNNQSWFARISGGLLYNTGRTITYAALGAIFGLAGMGLALGGLQQWVSIILGAVMILAVLIPRLGAAGNKMTKFTDSISVLLKKPFVKLFRIRTYQFAFSHWIIERFPALRTCLYCPCRRPGDEPGL